MQALDVTAEPDGVPPQRTEHSPRGDRSALALRVAGAGGICGRDAAAGAARGLHYWRRRSKRVQRLYEHLLQRCRPCSRAPPGLEAPR